MNSRRTHKRRPRHPGAFGTFTKEERAVLEEVADEFVKAGPEGRLRVVRIVVAALAMAELADLKEEGDDEA
jgi:hypothetical protein